MPAPAHANAVASTTVIDRFLIELGLDPKNLKKGSREAVAALAALKGEAKETGEEMSKSVDKGSSSLATLGKRVLTVAAIFKVLSYTTRNILEASKATYDLANSAKGVDQAARSLRNFENVAEIMGGTAEGARKTIEGMHKAIFNATFNGQISDQLVQLGRLGVQFQDAGGHMRDFKDIYLDTAQRIQESQANGSMTAGEALEFLQSAGFDPGLARAAVGGRDSAAAALARQEARRQIGDGDVANATANEQALTSANQAKDSAFVKAMGGASPWIQSIAKGKETLFNAGETGEVAQAWEALKAALDPAAQATVNFAVATEDATKRILGSLRAWGLGKGRSGYEGAIQSSAKKYGIDPEILAGVLHTESRFDPNAVSTAGAVGIAQLMPEYFPNAGINPVDDIDTAAGELARLRNSFMRTNGGNEADAWDRALMAYNGGERRVRSSTEFGDGTTTRGPLKGETTSYPGKVYEYAAAQAELKAGGGSTSIQIDEVNVNTAATDAQGIASGMSSAIKNKLGAAQAEQGQN